MIDVIQITSGIITRALQLRCEKWYVSQQLGNQCPPWGMPPIFSVCITVTLWRRRRFRFVMSYSTYLDENQAGVLLIAWLDMRRTYSCSSSWGPRFCRGPPVLWCSTTVVLLPVPSFLYCIVLQTVVSTVLSMRMIISGKNTPCCRQTL